MPVTTLTDFHHWLLADVSEGAPFILLDTGELSRPSCAAAIARHLNEFDESSGGNWIALDAAVIETIAADAAQRRLIGLGEPTVSPAGDPANVGEVLVALARRGHIVINHAGAFIALAGDPRGFKAALGLPESGGEGYHIILDPSGFPSRCLAPLVADSFLEWFNHLQAA
ncbi:hypothetical protein [Haloferula sargassicola]|uniref:Uncharacterized protein n=1 Tax=Haloferula sargassicola TaxID=490096 RepID=A0ABP9UQ55_9BACT